jgi:uncharacterized membrane protein
MTPYRPIDPRNDDDTELDSAREREKQRALALAASVGSLMVGMRRGGLSGLVLGAFSGYLAYRASTGRGLKGTGRALARGAERTLTGHRTGPLDLSASITIARSREELYAFWRDFTRLPGIMTSITAVDDLADGRSRWQAETPLGGTYEWEAEIVEDVPGERIAWRSVEGSDVPQTGEIRFAPAPAGRGTQVELNLRYELPHGLLAAAPLNFVNALSREAVREDLRHFKQVMEAGEVPTGAIHASAREGVAR